jgi:hypothetical protein
MKEEEVVRAYNAAKANEEAERKAKVQWEKEEAALKAKEAEEEAAAAGALAAANAVAAAELKVIEERAAAEIKDTKAKDEAAIARARNKVCRTHTTHAFATPQTALGSCRVRTWKQLLAMCVVDIWPSGKRGVYVSRTHSLSHTSICQPIRHHDACAAGTQGGGSQEEGGGEGSG